MNSIDLCLDIEERVLKQGQKDLKSSINNQYSSRDGPVIFSFFAGAGFWI